MTDLDPTVPLHYEPAPIGALSAKSQALQQALREVERLKAEVADQKRRIDAARDVLGGGLLPRRIETPPDQGLEV